jgi:aminoglycoside phosphotransferase (APT) family kinase protein
MPRYASLLADLHDQLHKIPAPEWLGQWSDGGDRLVHLDLHPLNVLMSAHGPVVIDWSNAARGEALSDVALTYVLLTCPRMPGPRALQIAVQPARVGLARLFARRYRGKDLGARIAVAADVKALDRNMSPDEIANLHRLARRMRQRTRLGPVPN